MSKPLICCCFCFCFCLQNLFVVVDYERKMIRNKSPHETSLLFCPVNSFFSFISFSFYLNNARFSLNKAILRAGFVTSYSAYQFVFVVVVYFTWTTEQKIVHKNSKSIWWLPLEVMLILASVVRVRVSYRAQRIKNQSIKFFAVYDRPVHRRSTSSILNSMCVSLSLSQYFCIRWFEFGFFFVLRFPFL